MADKRQTNAAQLYSYQTIAPPRDWADLVNRYLPQQQNQLNELVRRLNQVATPGYVNPPKG